MSAAHETINLHSGYSLTRHAWERMCERGLSPAVIGLVLKYGRTTHTRGAIIYAVGRNEVRHHRHDDIDLSEVEGIQVVCNASYGVVTAYRNRNFRGLRPRSRRTCRCHSGGQTH